MNSADPISERDTSPTGQYRVIAAADFSPLGDRAVLEALQFCMSRPHAALHVITVATEAAGGVILPGADHHALTRADALELTRLHLVGILDAYLAGGHQLNLDKVAFYVTVGTPAATILSLAADVDADLIVMGTHGRQRLGRALLGSVTGEVMRRAPCGVFVIRPRDFLRGEKLPEIQPPLEPGQHSLFPFRTSPTYHYVHRSNRSSERLMPAL